MKSEMERVVRSRKKARENYNAMSRWYDLFTSSEKRFTDIGIQMLDAQSNESILEIGCGTGYALAEFARRGGRVVAIDLSEKMLQVARRKVRSTCIGLCQADGLSIPFPDNSFDAIFISFTLELFDTPEIPNALKECHRTLKPDGRIGIVSLAKQETPAVSIYEWFHRKMPTFIDCRPIYLQRILKEAGFQVRESTIKKMWGLPVEIVIAKKAGMLRAKKHRSRHDRIQYNYRMSTLSPSAQKIQNLLNSLGYSYTVIEHAESTRTAQEAADRAGCELGQIVKSLIFKGKESGKPILVLTSGPNRANEKRISEYAGEPIGKADADFVRAVTGFAIGGVPPLGHIETMETYIDEDFLQYPTIWAAAGTPNAIFELKTEDLQTMTGGTVADIK